MNKIAATLFLSFFFLITLFAQNLTERDCAGKVLFNFSIDYNSTTLDEKISYLDSDCAKYFSTSSPIISTAHIQYTASPSAHNEATKKRLIVVFEKIITLHEKNLPDSDETYFIADMYLSLGVAYYDEDQISQIEKSISYLSKSQSIVQRLRSKNIEEKSYTNENYNWSNNLLGAFKAVRDEYYSNKTSASNNSNKSSSSQSDCIIATKATDKVANIEGQKYTVIKVDCNGFSLYDREVYYRSKGNWVDDEGYYQNDWIGPDTFLAKTKEEALNIICDCDGK